ncbi:MAG: DUF86 domain-containing protein [Paludibacteraceae bacterium]|nr:DUF86 domain-containing protein [Paludibacteraceae bacterium]
MRENIKDRDRLEHILQAIDCILDFADGKSKEDLEIDRLRYYGIIKNIEIIGEAAYKLSRTFCRQHDKTPWEFIAKMRHVLVHDYYQINAQEVWKVIHDDLHPLRQQIVQYLSDTNWEEWGKNEQVISELAIKKSLLQTVARMKKDGMDPSLISRYTGLSIDEIDSI